MWWTLNPSSLFSCDVPIEMLKQTPFCIEFMLSLYLFGFSPSLHPWKSFELCSCKNVSYWLLTCPQFNLPFVSFDRLWTLASNLNHSLKICTENNKIVFPSRVFLCTCQIQGKRALFWSSHFSLAVTFYQVTSTPHWASLVWEVVWGGGVWDGLLHLSMIMFRQPVRSKVAKAGGQCRQLSGVQPCFLICITSSAQSPWGWGFPHLVRTS